MKKILVIGSVNMDYAIYTNKIPNIGETVMGEKYINSPGGKGANEAYAIGKIGGNVSFVGAIGCDNEGKTCLKNLSDVNVDISNVEILDNENTGTAFVSINNITGDNQIIVIPGANMKLTTNIVDKNINLIKECDAVILQLEIPIETVKYIIKVGSSLNKMIIVDPAPAQRSLLDEVLDSVTFVKPNETELEILTGIKITSKEDIIIGAKKLLEKGVKNVLVTMGDKGTLLANNNGIKIYPSEKVEVVDTTAAGDTFLAVFTNTYLNTLDVDLSIKCANRVAGIVCTRKGAQISIPTKEEVNRILEDIND